MKNVFTFDIDFLKNHQSTKGYCSVCVDTDGTISKDSLSSIKEAVYEMFPDLSHLNLRYGSHYIDHAGTIKQDSDTIEIGIFNGAGRDKTTEVITRKMKW